MDPIGLSLRDWDSGHEVERVPLPSHALERLIGDTHMTGVLEERLPNSGQALRGARVELHEAGGEATLEVEVDSGAGRFRKRFSRLCVSDDTQVLLAQRFAAEAIPVGRYRHSLVRWGDERGDPLAFRSRRFARTLPVLPPISLEALGVSPLPRCTHPVILLPIGQAERLLAHARSSPEAEVGACLVGAPLWVQEAIPHRLGILVREAVPLRHGTRGDRAHVRIAPEALAAVPLDPARGRYRAGLAHSHVLADSGVDVRFLSPEDRSRATAFFYMAYQIQVVIDPSAPGLDEALAVFSWVHGRLERVCLQLIEANPDCGSRGNPT